MTLPESEFHDAVAAWLLDAFVHVEHEPTLPSGRRPDFIAYTPFESYVIEVENSGSSASDAYTGIGQAEIYALETDYQPVLVFPATDPPTVEFPGHIEVVTV